MEKGKVVRGRVHHVGLSASDLKRSHDFYDPILKELGFRHHNMNEKRTFWLGPETEILIYQAKQKVPYDRYATGFHHLALMADSRERVDAVYKIAKELGTEILDEPQIFPQYDKDYYAAFFLDPDGMKIEIMHMP